MEHCISKRWLLTLSLVSSALMACGGPNGAQPDTGDAAIDTPSTMTDVHAEADAAADIAIDVARDTLDVAADGTSSETNTPDVTPDVTIDVFGDAPPDAAGDIGFADVVGDAALDAGPEAASDAPSGESSVDVSNDTADVSQDQADATADVSGGDAGSCASASDCSAGMVCDLQSTQCVAPTACPAPTVTLFVDVQNGSDLGNGSAACPLRTLTTAESIASTPGSSVLQIGLAPGRYTEATGEVFPITLAPGISLAPQSGAPNLGPVIDETGANGESCPDGMVAGCALYEGANSGTVVFALEIRNEGTGGRGIVFDGTNAGTSMPVLLDDMLDQSPGAGAVLENGAVARFETSTFVQNGDGIDVSTQSQLTVAGLWVGVSIDAAGTVTAGGNLTDGVLVESQAIMTFTATLSTGDVLSNYVSNNAHDGIRVTGSGSLAAQPGMVGATSVPSLWAGGFTNPVTNALESGANGTGIEIDSGSMNLTQAVVRGNAGDGLYAHPALNGIAPTGAAPSSLFVANGGNGAHIIDATLDLSGTSDAMSDFGASFRGDANALSGICVQTLTGHPGVVLANYARWSGCPPNLRSSSTCVGGVDITNPPVCSTMPCGVLNPVPCNL